MIYKYKLLLTAFLQSTPVVTTINYLEAIDQHQKEQPVDKKKIRLEQIGNDVEKNKRFVGVKQNYKYDKKTFDSETSLNEYIFRNNRINSTVTSSNPYKIIKDYESMALDSDMIYSTDPSQLTQVYCDAFGNVAFSKEEALKTYINHGLIKPQYSYTGRDSEWFDSPNEAENYEKYNVKLEKSLYYKFNDRYYNAFETGEINALLDSMEDWYSYIPKNPSDGSLISTDLVSTNKEKLFNEYKNKIEDDFRYKHSRNVVKIRKEYGIRIESKNDKFFTKDKALSDKSVTERKNVDIHLNSKKYNFKSYDEIISWFDKEFKLFNGLGTDNYYYPSGILAYKGKNNDDRLLTLRSGDWYYYESHISDSDEQFNYSDITEVYADVYLNQNSSEPIVTLPVTHWVNSVEELDADTLLDAFNYWYKQYYYDILTKFDKTQTLTFDDIKNNKFTSNDKRVFYDKVYNSNNNKGHYHSVIRSWYEFNDNVRPSLLKNVNSDGTYNLQASLAITKKELDNFLPLYGDGEIKAKVMYSYYDNVHQISRDGTLLADTLVEAKNKAFLAQHQSLLKRYQLCDVFDNCTTTMVDKEMALDMVKQNISIATRYVDTNEIAKWNKKLKYSWDTIISDGYYQVYYITNNENGKRIYYSSFDLALKQLKKSVTSFQQVESDELKIYAYDFVDKNGQMQSIVFTGQEKQEVLKKINDLIG